LSDSGGNQLTFTSTRAATLLFVLTCTARAAPVVGRFDDRASFEAQTSGRTTITFENATQCVSLPDPEGYTNGGVNFNGGAARFTSHGSCVPPLSEFQGYVFMARVNPSIPAQRTVTATLPANVFAVGFDFGINEDPVTTELEITIVTGEGEQSFRAAGRGTGTGGGRRVTPTWVGFTSNQAITQVRFGRTGASPPDCGCEQDRGDGMMFSPIGLALLPLTAHAAASPAELRSNGVQSPQDSCRRRLGRAASCG
jgi:hypothetical protein